jgi:hypothetical protein
MVSPSDAEAILAKFSTSIERYIDQGVLQHDDEVHHYIFALQLVLQPYTAVSIPAEPVNASFLETNELTNESAESPCERQTRVEVSDSFQRYPVSSRSASQYLSRSYQDQVSSRISCSNQPSSTQYDDPEGTHALQPSHATIPPMGNVPNTSTVSDSLSDLRDTSTIQPHLAVSSSNRSQSEAISPSWRPIESSNVSNTEQSQDSMEVFGDIEFAVELPFDGLWTGNFTLFDTNTEFDGMQLHSDSLVELLESENDNPATFTGNEDIVE